MDPVVLDQIPFDIDMDGLMSAAHIRASSSDSVEFERLVADSQAVARPKAIYRMAGILTTEGNEVTIEGVRFHSRRLAASLAHSHRVFAYVATCGTELGVWARAIDDPLYGYWSEAIKQAALDAATSALYGHLLDRFRPGEMGSMRPGSVGDWPLKEQRPLFQLLGDPTSAIGVKLTDSCLMTPNKSVSGIRFPVGENCGSCRLCPWEECSGRTERYDRPRTS